MAAARYLTSYVTSTFNLIIQLHEVDYTTEAATLLDTEMITAEDVRYIGKPGVTSSYLHHRMYRITDSLALLMLKPNIAGVANVPYFANVIIDHGAGTISVGNFYQVYTWNSTNDEEIFTPDIHVIDNTHAIIGGQVRDLTGGARTFQWKVLDLSGVTPAIAWTYTDASTNLWDPVVFSSTHGTTGMGYRNNDPISGDQIIALFDVDMVGHTVTWRDPMDPSTAVDPVAIPSGGQIQGWLAGNGSDVLLDANVRLSQYTVVDSGDAYIYGYVFDHSASAYVSALLEGNVQDNNSQYEEGNTQTRLIRGTVWALIGLQLDGPVQQMTLVKTEISSSVLTGVDARISLQTNNDDQERAFGYYAYRDLIDAGNGVSAGWGLFLQGTGLTEAWAAVIGDDTTVPVGPTQLIAPTDMDVLSGESLMHVLCLRADAIPPATTEALSSASSIGDQIEVSTTTSGIRGTTPHIPVRAPLGRSLSDVVHVQHRAYYQKTAPAIVMRDLAVVEPALCGINTTSASITTADVRQELAAALDVDLGSTWRWLPGPSYHSGGPGMVWDPVSGARQWSAAAGSTPYVDPAFTIHTVNGDVDKPALIVDGGAYMQLPVDPHAAFTVAFVARLNHSPTSPYYDILSSPSGAADAVHGTDLLLRYRGARLRAWSGNKRYTDYEIDPWTKPSRTTGRRRRPVIIVWSQDQQYLRMGIVMAGGRLLKIARLVDTPGNYDLNFFFGRNGAIYDVDSTAYLQLFDLALWNNTALTRPQIRRVCNKLNSVYGVL